VSTDASAYPRVAVVTGGRSGIGRAVVEQLLVEGAAVASLDVSPLSDDTPVPNAAGDGEAARLLEIVCDVRSEDAVEAAIEQAVARWGGLDVVVQCAGVTADGVLWKMSDEAWRRVLDVNLTGAFHVLKAATPHLRKRGGGSVVHVTSINGFRGKFGQSNYAASKAGLVALTKTAARELGAFGIRVNAVAPGLVQTPMTSGLPPKVIQRALDESALTTLTQADDVAAAVLFLLSDGARQITGTTLRVDAGQCM